MEFTVHCTACGFEVDGSRELQDAFMDQTSVMDFKHLPELVQRIIRGIPSSKLPDKHTAFSESFAKALNTIDSSNWYCPECNTHKSWGPGSQ